MHPLNPLIPKLRLGTGLVLLIAVCGAVWVLPPASAADSKPAKEAKAEAKAEAKPNKKAAKKKLTGADLYAIHCNRCHPERYATERTAGQWDTIMMHMRVRANLPAAEAKVILKYLQEDSGK